MQSVATYIFCRQGMVTQWVELLPIFEVCTREKGCEGVGVSGGTHGGNLRRQKSRSGQPWRIPHEIPGYGGEAGT